MADYIDTTSEATDTAVPAKADLALDGLNIQELVRVHDAVCSLIDVTNGFLSQPRFFKNHCEETPAGKVLDQLCEQLAGHEAELLKRITSAPVTTRAEREAKAHKVISQACLNEMSLPALAALLASYMPTD